MILPYGMWLIWFIFLATIINAVYYFARGVALDDLYKRIGCFIGFFMYGVYAVIIWYLLLG